MVPKITGKGRIEYILRKGARRRAEHFAVRIMPNRTDHLRFCVVASKKVSTLAVQRNRARRRMYEAIRLTLPKLPQIGYDVCILVHRNILDAPFERVQAELITTLHG